MKTISSNATGNSLSSSKNKSIHSIYKLEFSGEDICGEIIELDFSKLSEIVGFDDLRKRLFELETQGSTLEDKWRQLIPPLDISIFKCN